ncbi:hypothetical protein KQI68_06385 [Peptoniphilus sp. MSJ-1]|uniref:Uncharacterized protein n=1 Tax=Peptoniphilus ovalis TaxID=2841503 RepID=A0ABS6FH35_9FIRM|nr:hypothetical protein [Peptoniphilus ovalis]MBU5669464.1 hypothetical protein [Peptoniphilus ovalis]
MKNTNLDKNLLIDYVHYESNSELFKMELNDSLLLKLWSNAIYKLKPALLRSVDYDIDIVTTISLIRLTLATVKTLDKDIDVEKYIIKDESSKESIAKLFWNGLNAAYNKDYANLANIAIKVKNKSGDAGFLHSLDFDDNEVLEDYSYLMSLIGQGTQERNDFVTRFFRQQYEDSDKKNIPLEFKLQLLNNVLRDDKITTNDLLGLE